MTSTVATKSTDATEAPRDDARSGGQRWLWLTVAALALPASFYLLFVTFYARNGIYWDEWIDVPIVDSALHHHLSFSLLWQQHNENRLLVPNAVVWAVGYLTHLNTLAMIYLSAVIFVVSFLLLLPVYARYSGRRLAPVQTLLLGILWFSVVDTENALWGFQFAWYLVVLCLMLMLFLLARTSVSPTLFALAALVCVIASYSSLQGVFLWPVGLICLVWRIRTKRALSLAVSVWLVLATVTMLLYFRGFDFGREATGGGSVSYAEHHLPQTFTYLLVVIGSVFPSPTPQHSIHEFVGVLILLMAGLVVVYSIATWRASTSVPLPLCLAVFGILFDLSIAFGRTSLGIAAAEAPRYSMPNLLILIALASFAFALPWKTSALVQRKHLDVLRSSAFVGLVVGVAVVGQLLLALVSGTQTGAAWRARIVRGDSIMVNLSTIPEPRRTHDFNSTVYPSFPSAFEFHWIHMVEQDQLGELSPGGVAQYRTRGTVTTGGR